MVSVGTPSKLKSETDNAFRSAGSTAGVTNQEWIVERHTTEGQLIRSLCLCQEAVHRHERQSDAFGIDRYNV